MARKKKVAAGLLDSPDAFSSFMVKEIGDFEKDTDLGALSTGVYTVDALTGIGGVPYGGFVEFFGPPSSGKSTLALLTIAEALKIGGAIYIDFEGGWDSSYAERLGITRDNPRFILAQPNSLEDAGTIIETALKTGQCRLVVLDSLATAITKAELEADIEQSQVAIKARIFSRLILRIQPLLQQYKASFIVVNHEKDIIGGRPSPGGYIPKTTPGGNALKYYALMRVQFRVIKTLKQNTKTFDGTEYEGGYASLVQLKTVKNKRSEPHQIQNFYIIFGKGVSNLMSLLDIGINFGFIKKTDKWFKFTEPYFPNELSIYTLGKTIKHFETHPEDYDRLVEVCLQEVPQLTPAHLRPQNGIPNIAPLDDDEDEDEFDEESIFEGSEVDLVIDE